MANNPTLLTMPIAENGQKNTIPATQAAAGDGLLSQSTGFPPETALPLGAGGVAPKREDFNGVFNLLSDIAFYAQKGWFFKWDENQDYFAGCVVRDTNDGYLYEAINDVSAGGSAPSADSTNWKIFASGGLPIGSVHQFLQTSIPDGWLSCENGQEVSRTAYPELWAWVQTNAPLITEAQWQTKAAAQKSVGYYSDGDGSTTFRLPRLVGFMEGVTAANSGQWTGAGLPNITGGAGVYSQGPADANVYDLPTVSNGAFSNVSTGSGQILNQPAGYASTARDVGLSFDASRSNAIYGNSATVQPESVGMVWCVRAFGAAVNQGTVDITELAQMLNLKLSISDAPRVCTPFAFPSDTYTTITLNTSGQTYTAPANGYISITGTRSAGAFDFLIVYLANGALKSTEAFYCISATVNTFIPCKKDDVVTIGWQGASSVSANFIYAQGEV